MNGELKVKECEGIVTRKVVVERVDKKICIIEKNKKKRIEAPAK